VAVPFDLRRRGLENSPQLDAIKKKAKDEVDVRYIGRVLKFATPAQQKRSRPLKIGVSVGHFKITAGTLGCFVRGLDPKDDTAVMILSNNHVLANENRARKGDAITTTSAISSSTTRSRSKAMATTRSARAATVAR
jgi:hypothetical protein